jgi:hypothetical protein
MSSAVPVVHDRAQGDHDHRYELQPAASDSLQLSLRELHRGVDRVRQDQGCGGVVLDERDVEGVRDLLRAERESLSSNWRNSRSVAERVRTLCICSRARSARSGFSRRASLASFWFIGTLW